MKNKNVLTKLKQSYTIAAILLLFCMASCSSNPTVPEDEYSTEIVGKWLGTVGDLKETMSVNSDGTFICQVYPIGFIANTLSEGVKGTISGTWKITAKTITLTITGEHNEYLENNVTSSTIESFSEEEIVLKSDRGETSAFRRAVQL